MTTTTGTTEDIPAPSLDRGGGPARRHLLRVREFMRGHGVASAAEVKAALGFKAARALARQTDRDEFVLLARGVSGMPGTTTASPEYRAFLERRRAAAAAGIGRRADRLVAWAAARDAFRAADAIAEFGQDVGGMITDAVRRGELVRTARGVYACRATGVGIARARHRLPAAEIEAMRTLAIRRGVFAIQEVDLPPGDRRQSVAASLVLRGEIVPLGRSIYALPHLDAASLEADACRKRIGPSPAERLEEWARSAGVFTVPEAVAVLGATARTMVQRRMAKGTIVRVDRGRYRWAGIES